MIIHVLCSDGSPIGVTEKTIYGDKHRVGVGGAELALLTMCGLWQQSGHQVTLYNDPWEVGHSSFDQQPVAAFQPSQNRDVLIIFRSPNQRAIPAKGLKIWWSCDQYTIGDFGKFSRFVDRIVCISPFHATYFEQTFGIKQPYVVDLPVRDDVVVSEKIPNRLIFTSVPDRGLHHLWRIYPRIKERVPDLSLVITSDYRLWGSSELNQVHRSRWIVHEGITFLGAVSRNRYLREISQAELMVYPCTYDELFCISVAEAQVAGVVCVSSAKGALTTTNLGHLFYVDCGNPHNDTIFVDRAVEILRDKVELKKQSELIGWLAKDRFSPDRILNQWNKIFDGKEI